MKKPKILIKLLAHEEKKLMKSSGFRQAFQLCLLKQYRLLSKYESENAAEKEPAEVSYYFSWENKHLVVVFLWKCN